MLIDKYREGMINKNKILKYRIIIKGRNLLNKEKTKFLNIIIMDLHLLGKQVMMVLLLMLWIKKIKNFTLMIDMNKVMVQLTIVLQVLKLKHLYFQKVQIKIKSYLINHEDIFYRLLNKIL